MLLVPETKGKNAREREKEDEAEEKNIDVDVFSFPFSLFFLLSLLSVIVRAECKTYKPNS